MLHDAKKGGGKFSEARIVMRSVAATKLPALTTIDVKLFISLMKDTWPGETLEDGDSSGLRAAVEAAITSRGLELIPEQVRFIDSWIVSSCAATKLPAFTIIDVELFISLMKDTWPGKTLKEGDSSGLRVAAEAAITS
jgi:hypothetical protein